MNEVEEAMNEVQEALDEVEEALDEVEEDKDNFMDTFPLSHSFWTMLDFGKSYNSSFALGWPWTRWRRPCIGRGGQNKLLDPMDQFLDVVD